MAANGEASAGRVTAPLLVAGGLAGAVAGAAWQRRRGDAGALADLLDRALPSGGAPVAESEPARLPEPVARWLRASGAIGKPLPAVVRLEQEGRLTDRPGGRWRPFTARQWITLEPPGFLWRARIALVPGVWLAVRDEVRDGRGRSTAAAWGVAPTGAAVGGRLDEASLQRWLAELVWAPAGALDGRIAWRQTGPDTAVATLTLGDATAVVGFAVDGAGRVLRVDARRWRADAGAVQGWHVLLSGWTPRGGVVVPSVAEVVWDDPAGAFTAIQLRVGVLEVARSHLQY